jgi:hypothetical protein
LSDGAKKVKANYVRTSSFLSIIDEGFGSCSTYTADGVTVWVKVTPCRMEQSELATKGESVDSCLAHLMSHPVAVVTESSVVVVPVVIELVSVGLVVTLVETLLDDDIEVEESEAVCSDVWVVFAVDTRYTVVEVILKQLQAELILLAGKDAGIRQAGGAVAARFNMSGPSLKVVEVETDVTVVSLTMGTDMLVEVIVASFVVVVLTVVEIVEETVGM